jgi:hypothetical protein
MNLPADIAQALEPLFEALPIDSAMDQLVVTRGARADHIALVETTLNSAAFAGKDSLASALWLYVDELDRSHAISQEIHTATGSYWHGIMHRREGDFGNSHYWFTKAGGHPAIATIEGYDPHAFVDEAAESHREAPAHLIDLQRREWQGLFAWCAGED